MTDGFLRRLASEIPLVDVERAMAERASPAVTAQLDAAQQEADRFGIRAVPSFPSADGRDAAGAPGRGAQARRLHGAHRPLLHQR